MLLINTSSLSNELKLNNSSYKWVQKNPLYTKLALTTNRFKNKHIYKLNYTGTLLGESIIFKQVQLMHMIRIMRL